MHIVTFNVKLVIDYPDELNAHAAKNFPGIIEGNIIQFYGLCPDCVKTH